MQRIAEWEINKDKDAGTTVFSVRVQVGEVWFELFYQNKTSEVDVEEV